MTTKCDPCPEAWSRRPHYAPRQTLSAGQLNAALADELQRTRLLMRSLHGYGVVFGYGLATDDQGQLVLKDHCVNLECGLALDRHGRSLHWAGGLLGMGHIVGKKPKDEGVYTLFVHYAERHLPTELCDPCCDEPQWTEQGVVFTLKHCCDEIDHCACPERCDDACTSIADYICLRTGATKGPIPPDPDLEWACKEPGPLCPTDLCGWHYDPAAGIPIACVDICDLVAKEPDCEPDEKPDCGPEKQREYEAKKERDSESEERPDYEPKKDPECAPKYGFCPCHPKTCEVRPFVYRTPLLYELILGCHNDPARVKSFNWQDWTVGDWNSVVPWNDFEARFDKSSEGFQIWFTKPIKTETLHPASVFLSAIVQERSADYWEVRRIPLRELKPLDENGGAAMGVRLLPEHDWIAAEITGRRSTLFEGVQIELTIRGQMLRDACDCMFDARPPDVDKCQCDQVRPGDDFIAVFRVGPKPREQTYRTKPEPDQTYEADPRQQYTTPEPKIQETE